MLRLIDLLAVAVEDIRQGGDPRLPLELALVKVTRPQADLSREAILSRLERLEARSASERQDVPAREPKPQLEPHAGPAPDDGPEPDVEQLQQVWRQAVLPALEERSIPTASMLREARPVELAGNRLVIEFPPNASFHRNLAEEPKNAALLAEVLHEVTGHRLTVAFAIGEPVAEGETEAPADRPTTEEELVSLLKDTFDAREVREEL